GSVFTGDQGVALGPCVKLYHPYPKTVILVDETPEILNPQDVDARLWCALFSLECGSGSSEEIASHPEYYNPYALTQEQYLEAFSLHRRDYTCEKLLPVPQLLARAAQAYGQHCLLASSQQSESQCQDDTHTE